jgi:hypothetical protein
VTYQRRADNLRGAWLVEITEPSEAEKIARKIRRDGGYEARFFRLDPELSVLAVRTADVPEVD